MLPMRVAGSVYGQQHNVHPKALFSILYTLGVRLQEFIKNRKHLTR